MFGLWQFDKNFSGAQKNFDNSPDKMTQFTCK